MVRKKLAMAILALSALHANFASALGLGNLAVKSALNQPLNAEIKLLDIGDLDPTQIKIQLGSPEDFQRSGVDRDYFLTNLRFNVTMDGRGGGTIQISTKEPVVEPYLNFVIEARWPSGRLLREFAVLLDPPTFSANKGAAPVAPAAAGGSQSARKSALQPPTVSPEPTATRTVPEADMGLPASGKPGEYRVQVYDTLSKIAARYKPASDVSVAQTMLAIQRANPEAFINNNINLIKSGAIVRLPSADDARAVPTVQAAQEAEDQTHAWRSGSTRSEGSSTAASGPQLDASAPEPAKAEGGFREKARLSIAAPESSDKTTAGDGAGDSGKGTEALRAQLTSSQEALEKGKRDNRELQSRLDDMERQIATLQRLISLKDDQLAALQASEKAGAAKPAQPAADAAATPPSATTPAPQPEVAPAPDAAATPPVTPPPVVPAPAPVPAKPAPAPMPAAQPSLLQQFISNPLYLGGAAALLLAIIAAVMLKRRREEQEDEDDFTLDDNETFQFDAEPDVASFNEETRISDSGTVEAAAAAPLAPEPAKTVRPETGDAIAESDIYIAYGRYQQAVDLLSSAIDAEPNRSDLRVKLLEVYVEMRNREAFRQQFTQLQALGDSGAVAQVKDMLSSVDGVSDWLDGLSGGSSSSYAASPSTTASPSYVAPAAAAAAAAATAATAFAAHEANEELVDDSSSDFAFDEPASQSPAGNGEELELGDDLELDLDLDDEAPHAAPSFDNSFGSPADSVSSPNDLESSDELEFNLDLDADTEASSAQELSDLSLDFDAAPPAAQTPAAPFDFNSDTADIDEGLELDLGDDDLDQMLGELGGADSLADLEEPAAAPADDLSWQPAAPINDVAANDFNASFESAAAPASESEWQPAPAAPVQEFSFEEPSFEPSDGESRVEEASFDLSEEFDLSNAGEDLSIGADLNFAASSEPVPEPAAPVTEPAFETPPTLDGGDDFDFLSDSDEVATKLDLARAYIDMGDTDGARDILDEVLQEGTDNQKEEASSLLGRIG